MKKMKKGEIDSNIDVKLKSPKFYKSEIEKDMGNNPTYIQTDARISGYSYSFSFRRISCYS
jgi:hypothetical protein